MIVQEKSIESFDQTKINAHIHENGSTRWIVVVHGLGEHGGRHRHIHKLFSQYFNICTFDLRGHGKSGGKSAFVESFDDYGKDLTYVLTYLQKEYSMSDYVLLGHSMGGLITSMFMQDFPSRLLYPKKVFLSSPAVGASGLLGDVLKKIPQKFFNGLTQIPTSLKVSGVLDIKKLSHDYRVYEQYKKDPLNHLKIHTKLLFEILKASKRVFEKELKIKCELYVAIGSKDALVNSAFCIHYFQKVESKAKLLIIKDGYHELHNEIKKYREPYFRFLKKSILDTIDYSQT